jgi:hypothetical protein
MNKKSKKPTKTSKKTKRVLKQYKSKSKEALDEFMELLCKNRDVLAQDITKELESILLREGLHTKNTTSNAKMPSKVERIKKLKNMEMGMAINDFPFNEYSTKHVNRLMRLLKIDKETAEKMSSDEKRKSELHAPCMENALDKTMDVELNVNQGIIQAINNMRKSWKDPFDMKSAFSSIDKAMKEAKKDNPKIISKWKISANKVDDSNYIYVDIDYKTTANTHRHIIQLTPQNFVNDYAFYDDTRVESLPKKERIFDYPEYKNEGF